ncbi:hypothetical protein ACFV6F_15700 [Kitasatospora phosalacinea]|uniref:hypothetical protein n=1 Tax=Kitasatospora phosalacinea TaxID=2065 RepID=UPI0036594A2C
MTTAPTPGPERDAVRRLAALLADLTDLTDDPAPTGRELAELLWLHALLDGPQRSGPDGSPLLRPTGGGGGGGAPPGPGPPAAHPRPARSARPGPGAHPAAHP